jgi:hypothetical protein
MLHESVLKRLADLEGQYLNAVMRAGGENVQPADCANIDRLRVELRQRYREARDVLLSQLKADAAPGEEPSSVEERTLLEEQALLERQALTLSLDEIVHSLKQHEQTRLCPRCCSAMQLRKRPRPEAGGAGFVHEDEWICGNASCGHVIDDSK